MQNLLFDFIEKYIKLSEEEKSVLSSLDNFRTLKKGTILLKEGQVSKDCYFVLQGCIRTYYMIDGVEKTTSFYTEMEGFSPNCVLNGTPSEYFVAAIEDSIVTVSNPDMEEEMFNKFPKFEKLCRILADETLLKERINFEEFKTNTPQQRYNNLLQKRPDLIQRIPQYQLASSLGITPQSLSRLRARGLKK